MKVHLRIINRTGLNPQFRVGCGTGVNWTRDTTSDSSKVTCKRCLAFIAKQDSKQP